ncbi:putative phenylacetyl- ligase protein [Botrytis fragariae]|uniref:Putative phenylacetyl- ligase protein n=1 Tax=Botrytis fragariae TaxID=1964551 RepID=A0A8H6AIA1_9HELO|nr:putative phenylacetyl- ligase protein [Botrytis fragariae]KAF5867820.1 putative phenylacetyl- ligase protein [Botrytis fragariae]
MSDFYEEIKIPEMDLWSTLFEREDKPFPDDQVLYTSSISSHTYHSIKSQTISFGLGLRNHYSFKKGDVLALFSENNIDTPITMWGTHYIGGIVSPANPVYTRRELTHHLRDCGAKIIVTTGDLVRRVRECVDDIGKETERYIEILVQGGEVPEGERGIRDIFMEGEERGGGRVEVDPENDLAYLVYSSGTTGLPKGVMLTHRNVVANLMQVASREGKLMRWDRDRILSVLPFFHAYGLQCLVHLPCYLGIPTIVMKSFSLPTFLSLIQEFKITYTYVAPPIVLHLAKSPVVEDYEISSLRGIVAGAAPLSRELIHMVKARLGVGVRQAYGLSETSPVTHIQREYDNGLGSVGPPLANQIVKFMSASNTEVPVGKEGEIWISGPNVFLGYHNNPDATSAALVTSSPSLKSKYPFFKTGDVGFQDANGNMYITDRVKELIKYKGYQVAPAELEGVLVEHEWVEDCCVVGVFDKERETEVPVGFLVGKGSVRKENGKVYGEREGREVEKWLGGKVADYKRLRGGVRWVESIPKSASGKILRRVFKEQIKKEKERKMAKL